MKYLLGFIFVLMALGTSTLEAAAPCKASPKTGGLLDQVLDSDTLKEIKADKDIQKEAFTNIISILQGDKCVKFLLGKSKMKNLAAVIIQAKQQNAGSKTAKTIEGFITSGG